MHLRVKMLMIARKHGMIEIPITLEQVQKDCIYEFSLTHPNSVTAAATNASEMIDFLTERTVEVTAMIDE